MSLDGKILLLDLLDLLQKNTDEHNGLNQKQIIDILCRDYGYEDLYEKRKTVKDNMDKLLEYSQLEDRQHIHQITYQTKERRRGKKRIYENTNFCYQHEFTPGELRLIIDGILFSKHLPQGQKKSIINKLENLTSLHFHSRMKYIESLSTTEPVNHQFFMVIEDIEWAIENNKKIQITYNEYRMNEQNELVLKPRLNPDLTIKEYLLNPYQLVATNGRYYLICNLDKYDDLSNYRVDRIGKIEILEEGRKPLRDLKDSHGRIDLNQYIRERIYMYQGKARTVKLRLNKRIITDFIDWFGSSQISFSDQTADEVTASVKVNEEAVRKWALQYGLYVRVLSPKDLVKKIKADIDFVSKQYDK